LILWIWVFDNGSCWCADLEELVWSVWSLSCKVAWWHSRFCLSAAKEWWQESKDMDKMECIIAKFFILLVDSISRKWYKMLVWVGDFLCMSCHVYVLPVYNHCTRVDNVPLQVLAHEIINFFYLLRLVYAHVDMSTKVVDPFSAFLHLFRLSLRENLCLGTNMIEFKSFLIMNFFYCADDIFCNIFLSFCNLSDSLSYTFSMYRAIALSSLLFFSDCFIYQKIAATNYFLPLSMNKLNWQY
jgi:hypothetical protein